MNEEIETKSIKCFACLLSFPSVKLLQNHVEENHLNNKNKLTCFQCKKMFGSFKIYIAHMTKLHYNKQTEYTCVLCNKDKRFKNIETFNRHLKIHYDPLSYKCTPCEKGFTRADQLIEHNKRHHQPRTKITCSECSKTFADKGSLDRHFNLSHKKEKNNVYTCLICLKNIKWAGNFTRHMKTVHKNYKKNGNDDNDDSKMKKIKFGDLLD